MSAVTRVTALMLCSGESSGSTAPGWHTTSVGQVTLDPCRPTIVALATVIGHDGAMPMFRRRDRSSRLATLSRRLVEVRTQHDQAAAQAAALAEEAEDLRVRALVSDDLNAAKEHRQAARHAEQAARAVERLADERRRLEAQIDALLDERV
jgi:hypothetical protein